MIYLHPKILISEICNNSKKNYLYSKTTAQTLFTIFYNDRNIKNSVSIRYMFMEFKFI